MKKYLSVLFILFGIYLFGQICYDLADPDNGSALAKGEISASSKLYDLKIFGEKLHLYFARTEKEKEKLEVIFLNRRLVEAEKLLENGKTGQAQQLVNKFAKGAEALMAELKKQDYLRIDPNHATEIENAVTDQINMQKNLMADIGTSSPLFPIKDRLLALELELADTPSDKAKVLENQLKDRLARLATSEMARPADALSDWQVIKNEMAQLGQRIKAYGQANLHKISSALDWAKSSTVELINKEK